MAIWQYTLIVVPKKSIQDDYECIFKNNKTNYLPSTKFLWKNIDIDVSILALEIDKFIGKSSWDKFNWKDRGENNDNDCSLSTNDDETQIEEFIFRTDLRKESNLSNFLKQMTNLCKKNKLVLINLKGEILEPNIEVILNNIKSSNAISFLSNPIDFLDELNNQNSH